MNEHMVIFCPIVQWPVHFETDLELAQRHLDAGGRVTLLHCRGALPICAQNAEHRQSVCRKCVSRFEAGIAWLGADRVTVRDFECLTGEQRNLAAGLSAASFSSLEQISAFTLDGASLGLAALGSVISLLREPKPDLRQNEALFTAYLKASAAVFYAITNQLLSLQPDIFVLFNGRFAELRAALYAAQLLDVQTYVHERAGVLERYSLMHNTSPHDIGAMKQAIDATYRESSLDAENKKRLAFQWYEERRSNKAQGWYSFTAKQTPGALPDFARDRLNLVIFNSSDDEIESFPDWRNPLYLDQNEGIRKIAADLCQDSRFKLFLRVHPNLRGLKNTQTEEIEALGLAFPGLTVIAADSPMSSYGILDACDAVLVFGSTIGIEASYAGKPSFLLARSFYEDLGCCVSPGSHAGLLRLLSLFAGGSRSMLPSPDAAGRAVIKFGFFQKSWGHAYRYVRPCHVGKSLMVRNGKLTRLRPSLLSWVVDKIATFCAR